MGIIGRVNAAAVTKKLGADPATSSAPFVATLVDVTGLIIYFSIAVLIMKGTLL
jgi:magnesium transporter